MDKKRLEEQILQYLKIHSKGVTLLNLKISISKNTADHAFIETVLDDMIEKGEIEFNACGIMRRPKTLADYIERVSDQNLYKAFSAYLSGNSVERYSSHEVRDRLRDYLKDRPDLEEDQFRQVFRSYRFDPESFTAIFKQPLSTYIYLRETCRRGTVDWRELRKDQVYSQSIRQRAEEMIRKIGFQEGNITVPFSTDAVTLYLLEKHPAGIELPDLYAQYQLFIRDRSPIPSGLELTKHRFFQETIALESVICGKGNIVRYRPTPKNKDHAMVLRLKLFQYRNQYLSTEIICRNSKQELEKADIQGPYELYHVLQKFTDICEKYHIQFIKAPFISVGNGDAVRQLQELLMELSPVTGTQLAQEYEYRYGMKIATVRAKLLKEVAQYQCNGFYSKQAKVLTDKQFEKIKKRLTRLWYFKSEVEDIFKKQVGGQVQTYMSSDTLMRLGYKVTSSIIYSQEFSSVEDCLTQCEWTGDTFQVSDDLWAIQPVYLALQKLERQLEIIEYAPQKFVRLKVLKRNGVYKKDLRAYMSEVEKKIEDEAYFTFKSLRADNTSFDLEEMGFDDHFYYSVLKRSKKIKGKHAGRAYLFRKSNEDATLPDFIEYVLSSTGGMDIYDFSDLIREQYGLELSPSYIRVLISNTQMYYDNISEKLFIDYDEYFEEI